MKSYYKSRSLMVLIITTLCVLGIWASQATIYEIVQGSGRVIPLTRTQKVQHLEGGIIKEIYIREGEHVKKGDELFLIDSLATNSEYNELMITHLSTQVKIRRLLAEKEGKKTLSISDLTGINSDRVIQSEKSLFKARRNELLRSLSILNQKVRQKELQIRKLKTEMENRKGELDISKKQMNINSRLHSKGVISETKLLASESQVQSLATKYRLSTTQLPVLEAEMSELKEKEGQITEERLSEILGDLNSEKVRFERIEEQLKKLQDRLTRATVLSPSDAIVNSLFVTTPGAVVQPGDVLLELTPTDGNVLIEGKVRAQDRGRIWLGQSVVVRVSAYDFTHYGALDGKVFDISADSFVDEMSGSYYRVKIKLDQATIKEKSEMKIITGMTADFHIRTGMRTVLQMVLAPVIEELWFTLAPLQE
jgi:adhesin transport system membrane fusion protein